MRKNTQSQKITNHLKPYHTIHNPKPPKAKFRKIPKSKIPNLLYCKNVSLYPPSLPFPGREKHRNQSDTKELLNHNRPSDLHRLEPEPVTKPMFKSRPSAQFPLQVPDPRKFDQVHLNSLFLMFLLPIRPVTAKRRRVRLTSPQSESINLSKTHSTILPFHHFSI